MKSKQIIINLIKVFLIVFLVVSFNLIMMPKYISENYDGRIIPEYYKEKMCPDVIFLGSSTVYSGVSPCKLYEDYGFTSYVMASSSQTSWDSYYVLKEALKKGTPKMVILDIGFMNQDEDYAEEVSNRKLFDYMRPSKNKFEAIDVAKAEGESKWDYFLPVLRYHERYKDIKAEDFLYAFYKPCVTYNGYIMSLIMSESLDDNPATLENAQDYSLNSKNAEYLQRIISLCKDNGIDILLVKTPSYQAKWGMGFESEITNIAALNGISYIDFDLYLDKMNIDFLTDSPDRGGHLNLIGAEKYTYCLGAVISENYDIPDRRQDKEYSDIWNSKLLKYNDDKMLKVSAMFGEDINGNAK